MNENAQKVQTVMNILAGLTPRVDQVSTLAQPIAYCVNLLADVRDALKEAATAEEKPKNKLDNLSDEEREGILNHAKEVFGNPAE